MVVQGEEYELLEPITPEVNWCRARNKFGLACLLVLVVVDVYLAE